MDRKMAEKQNNSIVYILNTKHKYHTRDNSMSHMIWYFNFHTFSKVNNWSIGFHVI